MDFLEELDLIDTNKEIKKVKLTQPSIDVKQPDIQESNKGFKGVNPKEYTAEEQLNQLYETLAPTRNTDKEERMKKVAAYNALGQGLTTIIDAFYGNKGAKIPVRQDKLTPYLMNSLTSEDLKFDAEKARYNNAKLSQMIRTINLDKERDLKSDDWDNKKELIDYEYQRRKELEGVQNKNSIDQINKKYDRMIELAKLNNASDEKQREITSGGKNGFSVVYGYDKNRQPQEIKLSDAVFRDVLKRVVELRGMGNDEFSKLLSQYNDPNGDSKTKNQIEEIVIQNWNKFYDVNDTGNVYLKEKTGSLYDKDVVNSYKSKKDTSYSTGGAY